MKITKKRLIIFPIAGFLTLIIVASFAYYYFLNYFNGYFFPGVKIAGTSVSSTPPTRIRNSFNTQFQEKAGTPLKFIYQDQTYTIDVSLTKPQLNLEQQVNSAYTLGRSGDFLKDLTGQAQTFIQSTNFPLQVTYQNEEQLTNQLSQIGLLVRKAPVNAQLLPGDQITVVPAQDGEELDQDNLRQQIDNYLSLQGPMPQTLPMKVANPQFTTESAERAKAALENVKVFPIKLYFDKDLWTIDQTALLSLLDFSQTKPVLASADLGDRIVTIENITVGNNKLTDSQLLLDKNKLTTYLKDLSDKINQPTQDAKFNFDQAGKRVVEFQPEQDGRELDIEKTSTLITQALESKVGGDINLPVTITRPKVNAASINNYGIKELLGEGISHFAGSIENRIFNIGLAASRLNGTLVPPGETFSFNGTVGEISGASGYKPAYVIKSGRTVLDDGGGVCQVSTTLFRSVLNAGLPVIERTAHAYRVGYYEQGFPPGLDATVFSPTVDFKFKNDTSAYILIQTTAYGTNLTIDIYGTSDGRIATLTTPVVYSQTPPPPELRQDDPTLPKGVVKQVDWSAWGANVSFKRTVIRGNESLISETWRSNFKPWQAIYLVGTKE